MIRRILLVTTALAAMSGAALAADLPGRSMAPIPYAPAVFSWTGFYIGANAGGSMGDFVNKDRFGTFGSGDQVSATSRGFSGGGQLGFNYQFAGSNVVMGVEADLQRSTLKGLYDSYTANGQAIWRDGSEVNWWGTLRGRVGYAMGRFLPYATAGIVYGDVKTSGSCSNVSGPFGCDQSGGSVSGTHTGWSLGGGVEYAVTDHLTAKVEYLYANLGSVTASNHYLDATYGGPIYSPGDQMQTKATFSTIRVGLNWKL
jgi:outer membrane immunogenic protein